MHKHSELTIRDCRAEDLPQLVEIEKFSFDDPYPSWLFAELLRQYPKGFRIAVLNNEIVGYCIASPDNSNKVATINSLAILPKYRRMKIGSRLMEDAILYVKQNLPQVRKIALQVALDNTIAQSLYRKFGFVNSFTINGYYGKNMDGMQMELSLT